MLGVGRGTVTSKASKAKATLRARLGVLVRRLMDGLMDLDEELRRLFDDLSDGDRLDIRIRPGAERAVLAGVRRVRRRRCLAAGAVALVVLVGGGIAAAASGTAHSLSPAESSTVRAGDVMR